MSSGDPFSGGFPFFDLSRLFGGVGGPGGNDPWRAAADIAAAIASDGGTEPNLDPVARMEIEDLARVAELHVGQSAGPSLPSGTRITAVNRAVWTTRSFEAYQPFFERFSEALASGMDQSGPAGPGGPINPFEAPVDEAELGAMTARMMAQMFTSLGPMLVSTSAGTMLGHLGKRALGHYDLPIPRPGHEILVIPSAIDAAAEEWGVDTDELRLWMLVHELATHAVLSVRHLGGRLEALLIDFAAAFRPNTEAIAERFGQITDLQQIQELSEQMSNPEVILSMLRTPAHDLLVPQLDALVAVVLGLVDHTVSTVADPLISGHDTIRARFRQRWIDVAPADRFMEQLLGLEIDEDTLNRGDRFVSGVMERAGTEGLQRVWADELDLPTAAEVDAPGLWLARIGADGPDGSTADAPTLEIPDDLSGLEDLD